MPGHSNKSKKNVSDKVEMTSLSSPSSSSSSVLSEDVHIEAEKVIFEGLLLDQFHHSVCFVAGDYNPYRW